MGGEALPVCYTRAMALHAARQLVANARHVLVGPAGAQQLGHAPWAALRRAALALAGARPAAAAGAAHAAAPAPEAWPALAETLDRLEGAHAEPAHRLKPLLEHLRSELVYEMPALDAAGPGSQPAAQATAAGGRKRRKVMGYRGALDLPVVSVRECDADGTPMHRSRGGPANASSHANSFVEVARVDALRTFDLVHPEAHYRTPHGRALRVMSSSVDRQHRASADWLHGLRAVYACAINWAQDHNAHCLTEGVWTDELVEIAPPPSAPSDQPGPPRVGVMRQSRRFEGYRYRHAYTLRYVDEEVTRDDILARDPAGLRAFERTASWEVSGWVWDTRCRVPAGDGVNEDNVWLLAELELRARLARALQCGETALVVQVDKRVPPPAHAPAGDALPAPVAGPAAPASASAAVTIRLVEPGLTGVVREAWRHMACILCQAARSGADHKQRWQWHRRQRGQSTRHGGVQADEDGFSPEDEDAAMRLLEEDLADAWTRWRRQAAAAP